jgi:5,10-methylenetetrahydromethanopterin reductase
MSRTWRLERRRWARCALAIAEHTDGGVTVQGERYALGVTNCRSAADVVAAVVEAEALGAEIAFIAEDINCRDSFVLGALAAQQTASIRISTGVANPYTRSPTSLAMAVATLDEVSGGRAMLGLGTSSPSLIEEQMGIPVGRPVAVMREATGIIRQLLAGETVTQEGERFRFQSAVLDVRPVQDRLPIVFAAMGPQMLRLAGRIADGVLLNVGATTEYIRWAVDQIASGAAAAGRPPEAITIAAWLTAYVTDEFDLGLQRAREWLAGMLSIPRQGELLLEHAGGDPAILPAIREACGLYPARGDLAAGARLISPELAERMTIIGTPDRARERLGAYRTAGVQVPVLSIAALRAVYAPTEPRRTPTP